MKVRWLVSTVQEMKMKEGVQVVEDPPHFPDQQPVPSAAAPECSELATLELDARVRVCDRRVYLRTYLATSPRLSIASAFVVELPSI
jgi:hypothetical protein